MFLKNRNYTIINGIYSFIDQSALTGDNLKYNKLYNRIAKFYNLSQRLFFWFKYGGEYNFRKEFLNELYIKDGETVLEISTGTGDNFRFLNRSAKYVGADISLGMLRQAKKHIRKWKLDATLVHCEGENLPFENDFFDVVFHCGGINFFNDKKAAIDEMIRVAKPGSKLLIVDETEELIKSNYQKNPALKDSFKDIEKAAIPIDLVPSEMEDIKYDIICKGLMYKITFIKPKL